MSSITTTTSSTTSSYNLLSAIGRMAHAEQGIQSYPESNALPLYHSSSSVSTTDLSSQDELKERETAFDEAWFQAGGGTLRSPSTGITSTTHYLGYMLDDINERREALSMPPYSPPTSQVSRGYIPPPPPALQRVNAFSSHTGPAGPVRRLFQDNHSTDEDDLMDRLRSFRSELQLQQDGLYRDAKTQDEVKALNKQYEELSDKIHSIEVVLSTFGAIFRTR